MVFDISIRFHFDVLNRTLIKMGKSWYEILLQRYNDLIHFSDFVFVEVDGKTKGGKQSRLRLTLSQKAKIIEESMKPGFSQSQFSRETGLSTSTISRILMNKFAIYCDPNISSSSKKNMTYTKHDELEKTLYDWYLQQSNEGVVLNGPMILSKAKELSNSYACSSGVSKDLKFTNGWLAGFKSRYNISFKKWNWKCYNKWFCP